jgi:hypothetical protein
MRNISRSHFTKVEAGRESEGFMALAAEDPPCIEGRFEATVVIVRKGRSFGDDRTGGRLVGLRIGCEGNLGPRTACVS